MENNFKNTNVTVDEVIEFVKTKVVPTVKSVATKVFEKSKTLVQNYQSKVEMDQQQEILNKHKIKRVLIKLILTLVLALGVNSQASHLEGQIVIAPIFLGAIWLLLVTLNILKTRVFTCLSGLLNKASKIFLIANVFGLALISSLEFVETYIPALVLGSALAIIFDYILPTKVRTLWSKI